TTTPVTTVCVKKICEWSKWYDSTQPENGTDSGDYETLENLSNKGYSICKTPSSIECRAKDHPEKLLQNLNQTVRCTQNTGLICNNKDQQNKICYNYQIKLLCCSYIPCAETPTTTTVTKSTIPEEPTPFTKTINTIQTIIKTTPRKETQEQRTNMPKTSTTTRPSLGTTTPAPTATASTLPESTWSTTRSTTSISQTTAPPT
ncbi:MUC5B protein, partial [Nothoprocta ornata]|nr:MUC5B protein [Nothoprocta ornata]